MPTLQVKKRHAQEDEEPAESSPEPDTLRRRTNHGSDNEEYDGGANVVETQGEGLEEMAKKLVRLALACEYQRKPIRKAEIGDKVLGPNGRQFKTVFNCAQTYLRAVFGMEMVELPVKEKVTLQQKRAAQKAASQNKGTTAWMLSSILPPEFQHPDIVQPSAAPTTADEAKYTAVYTLLVTLISLSGGILPDAKMERCLRKMQMEDRTPIDDFDKTEKLMKRMEKDGYIVRVKESTGTGEDDIYWTVGPRGKVEVGERGVRGLTKAVYGDQDEEADEELDRKIARSLAFGEKVSSEKKDDALRLEKLKKRGKRKSNAQDDDEDEDDNDDDEDDDDY